MQGNGFLIFIISATALWIIGKGLGPNVGPAWNTLTGASKTATTTAQQAAPQSSSGGLFQTANIPSFPSPGAPTGPGSLSYQPAPIPYMGAGVSIAA